MPKQKTTEPGGSATPKTNRAALGDPVLIPAEAGLAVSATWLSAATAPRATAATTAATTLLSTGACTCGTVTALRCGGASRCGHGLLAFLNLIGIGLVVDLEAFYFVIVVVEVSAALESDGVLGSGTIALWTRCALGALLTPFATFTSFATILALAAAAGTAGLRNLGQAEFGALLAQHSLAGELDAVAFDGEYLDEDLIALAELVLDLFHAVLRDLGDVQEAVGAGEDFDEGAELGETHDLAEVGLADLGHSGKI